MPEVGGQFRDKFVRIDHQIARRDPTPDVAISRVRNMYVVTKSRMPQAYSEGRLWYPRVHEMAVASPHSIDTASGVIAATSPNADFERNNIHALTEINNLTQDHWSEIAQDSAEGGKRGDALKATLKEHAPSMSTAPNASILRAGHVLGAVVPDVSDGYRVTDALRPVPYNQVLDRRTQPKTNTFAKNIHMPYENHGTTIDGRQADIVADIMRPWGSASKPKDPEKAAKKARKAARTPYDKRTFTQDSLARPRPNPDRGIGKASLPTGKTSRYEQYDEHHRQLAKELGVLPHEIQAVTWVGAKHLETRADESRDKGDPRRGQQYSTRLDAFTAGQLR